MKVFSGIRPTGVIHLGNYLGAIKNWLNMQKDNDCLFCIVDLHALTTAQGENIKEYCYLTAATYLACGIRPDHIFIQSHVPQHTELSWILSCHTSLGWLNRMTQFKEKSKGNKDKSCLGLYAYPVLMASDILLYGTTHVPVGEDQKQHVELARDIAISMNQFYKKDIFTIPEPLIQKFGARIMSLSDGNTKMGKSNSSDKDRINLTDTNDIIEKKIKKAKTDTEPLPSTPNELETRKEAKNLLTIIATLENSTLEKACQQFSGQNFQTLKKYLIDCITEHLSPIREKINEYLKDKSELDRILKNGAEKAKIKGQDTLKKVFKAISI